MGSGSLPWGGESLCKGGSELAEGEGIGPEVSPGMATFQMWITGSVFDDETRSQLVHSLQDS